MAEPMTNTIVIDAETRIGQDDVYHFQLTNELRWRKLPPDEWLENTAPEVSIAGGKVVLEQKVLRVAGETAKEVWEPVPVVDMGSEPVEPAPARHRGPHHPRTRVGLADLVSPR